MPPKRKGAGKGKVPSAVCPLLNVLTDGRSKARHNREVMRILELLRGDGVQRYNLHHIRDGGLEKDIPLFLDGHLYDIGYICPDGEAFLIEVMRVKLDGKGDKNRDSD